MKRKLKVFWSLVCMASFLVGCSGGNTDNGIMTDDLRYIPLFTDDGALVYVDLETGEKKSEWGVFEKATLFYEGYAVVKEKDGEYFYFIDKKGNPFLKDSLYVAFSPFQEGIAWGTKANGNPLAVDKDGKVLFELKEVELVFPFHNGYAVYLSSEGDAGLVDKKGKKIARGVEQERDSSENVPMFYIPASLFVNDYLPVLVGNDKTGKSGSFYRVYRKEGDQLKLCKMEAKGLNIRAEEIAPEFKNNFLQAFCENRVPVQNQHGKWGVAKVDDSSPFIDFEFKEIVLDGKNYMIKKGDGYGWINAKGDYIINPRFAEAFPFGKGDLAAVAEDGDGEKWGYINKKGDWEIMPQYYEALPFNGRTVTAAAMIDDEGRRHKKWGLIDKKGRWVVDPQFRRIYDIGIEDRFLVQDDDRYFGVIDLKGKYIVRPVYDNAPNILSWNMMGCGDIFVIESKFVDLGSIVSFVAEQLEVLKPATAEDLKIIYGISENSFPKPSGTVKLKDHSFRDMANLKVSAGIGAWAKVSDGWFGYNYQFLPDVKVPGYSVKVSMKGKARQMAVEVLDMLRAKYSSDGRTIVEEGLNEETGIFVVNGVQVSISSLSIDSFELTISY